MAMAREPELLPTHTIDHIEGQPECLLMAQSDITTALNDVRFWG